MTAAIGRIVQETGSIVLTPEGPPWCHEAMTTLDSYLTLGRSGLPEQTLTLLSAVLRQEVGRTAVWRVARKRIGQWAGAPAVVGPRWLSRYSWSAGAYERPMIRPSGD